ERRERGVRRAHRGRARPLRRVRVEALGAAVRPAARHRRHRPGEPRAGRAVGAPVARGRPAGVPLHGRAGAQPAALPAGGAHPVDARAGQHPPADLARQRAAPRRRRAPRHPRPGRRAGGAAPARSGRAAAERRHPRGGVGPRRRRSAPCAGGPAAHAVDVV
ncbi:MAG: hypothetical protein AVDCRST_MAG54-119, partial [uncultured Actinomycetospora sp.]